MHASDAGPTPIICSLVRPHSVFTESNKLPLAQTKSARRKQRDFAYHRCIIDIAQLHHNMALHPLPHASCEGERAAGSLGIGLVGIGTLQNASSAKQPRPQQDMVKKPTPSFRVLGEP